MLNLLRSCWVEGVGQRVKKIRRRRQTVHTCYKYRYSIEAAHLTDSQSGCLLAGFSSRLTKFSKHGAKYHPVLGDRRC